MYAPFRDLLDRKRGRNEIYLVKGSKSQRKTEKDAKEAERYVENKLKKQRVYHLQANNDMFSRPSNGSWRHSRKHRSPNVRLKNTKYAT